MPALTFVQENSLAPGTGLGLSIVKSIIVMTGGSIDIKSRLGEGTTVRVSLPVMRPPAGSEAGQSTPRSINSSAAANDAVQLLREEGVGRLVAIYGYSENPQPPCCSREYCSVLAGYIKEWYGLRVCDWKDRLNADVLIIEERDVPEVLDGEKEAGLEGFPALIVLCANATRHSEAEADTSDAQLAGVVEYLSKPCGPYKLAKALRTCLGRLQVLKSKNIRDSDVHKSGPAGNGSKELDAPAAEDRSKSSSVRTSDTMSPMFGSVSTKSDTPNQSEEKRLDGYEFPFPRDNRSGSVLSPELQDLSKYVDPTPKVSLLPEAEERRPRILLVDDNKINLQLLQTFMRKKSYQSVDSAQDGNIAVHAVKTTEKPYDIIFMGKSSSTKSNLSPFLLPPLTASVQTYQCQS
jgi:CheY-like chemotaxis protein